LTDHNRLAGHQEKWAPIVEEIIDHHKDEKLYNVPKRTLAVVGSACTLVAEVIVNDTKHKDSIFSGNPLLVTVVHRCLRGGSTQVVTRSYTVGYCRFGPQVRKSHPKRFR
jgi:hypothetical protein